MLLARERRMHVVSGNLEGTHLRRRKMSCKCDCLRAGASNDILVYCSVPKRVAGCVSDTHLRLGAVIFPLLHALVDHSYQRRPRLLVWGAPGSTPPTATRPRRPRLPATPSPLSLTPHFSLRQQAGVWGDPTAYRRTLVKPYYYQYRYM